MNNTQNLQNLVNRFLKAKIEGSLKDASEATMRTWIDELLSVFGWNVQDTRQVLTEHTLNKAERQRLKNIGSTNIRPDYTLVNGKVPLLFIDAKSLMVDIENDRDVAFQIRSYGWSIGAPYSIVTNFSQLAVYDCSHMPSISEGVCFARITFMTAEDFVENIDKLSVFLSRRNVLDGYIKFVQPEKEALDKKFSDILGKTRIDLAKAIIEKNKIDNVNRLSYYVQIIINRILFIRVCESRGLEKNGLLKSFLHKNFWEAFKQSSYGEFYDHYDGPMFKKISSLHSLRIDNEVFESLLNNLYYPSPYRFDVIPLKTLSDIYDLFLGYQLVVKGGKVSDELKSEFKKSNGAITTPEHLVNQVIESTMPSNVISNLSIEQCFKLKIIDIACGSGVFLVGAYDYLIKQIEKKLEYGEECEESLFTQLDTPVLNIEGRRKLINDCIYGVDINPEAVEVSKMSLCLKLIDNFYIKDFEAVGLLGSQILQGIGTNIKCGNSLVGTDIISEFPSIKNNIIELQETNAFNWEESFPVVFENGGFDYVVGNPPYVEVKNYNVNLPYMSAYIKRIYSAGKNGKIDLAIPFIEKGVSLLNANGRLGYIVQKRFFKTEYGKGIRKLLTTQKKLNGVFDYVETDLFAGRITYVAIVVCDNNEHNNDYVWYMQSDTRETQLLNHTSLTETPWNFENAKMNALRLRLTESLGTLKDICNVKVGVQVLWNDAFQIHVRTIESGIIRGYSAIDDDVTIELGVCKPLLCNEQFAPLTKREYTTYAFFPYDVTDDGDVAELNISDIKKKYPLAYSYLTKHHDQIVAKVETLPSRNREYNMDEHWHLFTRANNHGAVYEKLAVPMTSQYPQAAVVMDKYVYCDNANMFFIQIPNTSETKLYALSAIINSSVFCALARSIANPQQGGYYKFNKQFLDPVPVPVDAFKKCNANIRKLALVAKQIEAINEQIRISVGEQTSGLENALKSQWEELDQICDKLYGLTINDKSIIYSSRRFDRNPYGQED
ncbi:MAG: N-6 DNA methylase [Paludibacteraceae bacterium]|nr:N-6 DNA methylase [Paludibacteraceae bacterium]